MLIDGYKWDMRVYVLVTSVHPLTVYLYTDGLARFCTDPYEPPASDNLSDREMHLTNFSINYESDAFDQPPVAKSCLQRTLYGKSRAFVVQKWTLIAASPSKEDTEDGATGSKRSLRTVLDCCVADGPMLRPAWQSTLVECEFHTECTGVVYSVSFKGSVRSSAGFRPSGLAVRTRRLDGDRDVCSQDTPCHWPENAGRLRVRSVLFWQAGFLEGELSQLLRAHSPVF